MTLQSLAIALVLVVATHPTGVATAQTSDFPAELPQLKLWAGKFTQVAFFKSSKADVLSLFPDAQDQGDWLVVYLDDWEVTFRFPGATMGAKAANLPADIAGKLLHVNFKPRPVDRLNLQAASFGKSFRRHKKKDVDSPMAWVIYSHSSGIRYGLYAADEGGMKAGDVDFIEYSPSEKEMAKHGL